MNGYGYRVESVGSCNVSPELASQWRNGPHWHVIWPHGDHWCYETSAEAVDRHDELVRFAREVEEWKRGCQCVGGFHGGYTCAMCSA